MRAVRQADSERIGARGTEAVLMQQHQRLRCELRPTGDGSDHGEVFYHTVISRFVCWASVACSKRPPRGSRWRHTTRKPLPGMPCSPGAVEKFRRSVTARRASHAASFGQARLSDTS
jgi:hypothetical protein